MKKDYSVLCLVLDESGSMSSLRQNTQEGVIKFIDDNLKVPGTADVSVYTFSENVKCILNFQKLTEIDKNFVEMYKPDGWTAMYDGIGTAIDEVGLKLSAMKEEDRPSNVIFLIITDGMNNRSKLYTKQQIKEKIILQREKYNWTIIFSGANIDVEETSEELGLDIKFCNTYVASDTENTKMYSCATNLVSSVRCVGSVSDSLLTSLDWKANKTNI